MKKINLSIPTGCAALTSGSLERLDSNNPSKSLYVAAAVSFAFFYLKQIDHAQLSRMMDEAMDALSGSDGSSVRFRLDASSVSPPIIRHLETLSPKAKRAFIIVSMNLFESMLQCELQLDVSHSLASRVPVTAPTTAPTAVREAHPEEQDATPNLAKGDLPDALDSTVVATDRGVTESEYVEPRISGLMVL